MAVTNATPDMAANDGPRIVPAHTIRRRARLEQALYGAATLGISIGPAQPDLWPAHLTAGGLALGSLSWLWGKWNHNPDDNTRHLSFLQAAQRALPSLTGASVYLTDLLHPGTTWWEYTLPAAWGLLMAATTPITHSLNLNGPRPHPPPQPAHVNRPPPPPPPRPPPPPPHAHPPGQRD
ncbi:hypothetical protein ACWGOK_39100, partial [Streptomyces eurythermus]